MARPSGARGGAQPASVITAVVQQGPVISEVDVQTDGGIVTATITTRSIKHLKLAVGSQVLALIKSSDVVIATLRNANHDAP